MKFNLVPQAHAQVDIGDLFAPAKGGYTTIADLVNILLPNLLTVAGLIAFFAVIFAGVKFIQSAGSGDAKQIEQSKGALTAAIIGLILIFGAFFITNTLGFIVGLGNI